LKNKGIDPISSSEEIDHTRSYWNGRKSCNCALQKNTVSPSISVFILLQYTYHLSLQIGCWATTLRCCLCDGNTRGQTRHSI